MNVSGKICNQQVNWKIDAGAKRTFMTLDTFKSIQYRNRPALKATKCSFKAANGYKVFCDGVASVVLNFKETDWDLFLDYTVIAYNSSVHESTGYSPHRIVYGKYMSLPINVQTGSELNGSTGDRHNNIPNSLKISKRN
jgi:hypothetical protein